MEYFWHEYLNIFSSEGLPTCLQCCLCTCCRYKSVVLASNDFARDFTSQIMTAGQVSPVKVQLLKLILRVTFYTGKLDH